MTIEGADIATYIYEPTSSNSRGDVVLCHGTPWSASVWARVAADLSRDHRVLLWDMPGYGQSTQDPSIPVGLSSQMRRLSKLLDFWRLPAPHVIAHDIGGATALGAHLLHQRTYSSLFLWDTVTLEPWGSPFFRLVAEHQHVFTQLPAPLHLALVKTYIGGAAHRRLPERWIDALAQPWSTSTGQAAFYRQIAALHPEDTRPVANKLREVRCPVAVGWGEEDPWIPADQASRLQQLLPGHPSMAFLEGVGHLGSVEAPEQVVQAVRTWLLNHTE